jgi:hypothetical protein
MKLQKISIYLYFAQLHLLTIKYLDSIELFQVITLQLPAPINVTDHSEVKYHIIKRVTKIEFIAMIWNFHFFLNIPDIAAIESTLQLLIPISSKIPI